MQERLDSIISGWLLPVPLANPMIVNMFRLREREREITKYPWDQKLNPTLLPWSGEFAGKHLLSAELVYRMTSCPILKKSIDDFVADLISTQDTDGYMGPFTKAERFDNNLNWDFWGQYHVINGLLLYYDDTGYNPALDAACKAADLICKTLMPQKIILNEMNYGIIHCMVNLYIHTGNIRYLKMAEWVIDSWDQPGSLAFIKLAIEGKPVVQYPAHRWESAHSWQGIAEMYLLTGDEKYKVAFSHIWKDALQGDRHNTGGWTSGEGIQNNPYNQGAIETCCTVTWIAMTTDMLRLTGDSKIADELELSTLNGNIGGMHPSGRWWTYNTPMDGNKKASIHDINFQHRVGSPELNCCSVNGPRGLGMVQDWAVMKTADGYAVNWYGPCTIQIPMENENILLLEQKTLYPSSGNVILNIGLKKPAKANIRFRIPSWSEKTSVSLNGICVGNPPPGKYLELDREWRDGDWLEFSFDMSPHYWLGEREDAGKISIYSGPILLAWDQQFNTGERKDIPAIDISNLELEHYLLNNYPKPITVYRIKARNNNEIILCDFATAG
ncbi:MAG: beta-L-arabinofuranosidase domain-containing protein, partial [Candidatus Latescibacterota bacterium]